MTAKRPADQHHVLTPPGRAVFVATIAYPYNLWVAYTPDGMPPVVAGFIDGGFATLTLFTYLSYLQNLIRVDYSGRNQHIVLPGSQRISILVGTSITLGYYGVIINAVSFGRPPETLWLRLSSGLLLILLAQSFGICVLHHPKAKEPPPTTPSPLRLVKTRLQRVRRSVERPTGLAAAVAISWLLWALYALAIAFFGGSTKFPDQNCCGEL